ncbi:unnamed protein product [Cochlearia groenlandica]
MTKQNDFALNITGKVIDYIARNSNFVYSPASINVVTNMMAVDLNGSITDEAKAVYSEIANLVFADGSDRGGPKISAINGFWKEQSLPVNHSVKEILENVFKATYAQVDFLHKSLENLH